VFYHLHKKKPTSCGEVGLECYERPLYEHLVRHLRNAIPQAVKGHIATAKNIALFTTRRALELPADKRSAWLRQRLMRHGVIVERHHSFGF
jgi:hypothetical protein